MTTPENPFNHSDDYIPHIETHDTADIEPDVLLLDRLFALKDVLQEQRDEPDFQTHHFQFDIEVLDDAISLPESVEALIAQGHNLSTIHVSCARIADSPQSEITYETEFIFENAITDKKKILVVKRPYNYSYSSESRDTLITSPLSENTDRYFSEQPNKADQEESTLAVSPREFNRFISSLIYRESKYMHIFDNFDWQYDRLVDHLTVVASTVSGEGWYYLGSPRGGLSGELSYGFLGDEIVEFNLDRTLNKEIAVSPTGDIDYKLSNLRVIVNDLDDPIASFWHNQHIDGKPMTKTIASEDVDYDTLFTFINQHISDIEHSEQN